METLRKTPAAQPGQGAGTAATAASPAALAKGALRRLAQAQLEPTPENYARAYAEESGVPAPAPAAAAAAQAAEARTTGHAWAGLIERMARSLERGGRQWTPARRKDSLQRVLSSSRSDAGRLQQRLQSLISAWEADRPADPAETGLDEPEATPGDAGEVVTGGVRAGASAVDMAAVGAAQDAGAATGATVDGSTATGAALGGGPVTGATLGSGPATGAALGGGPVTGATLGSGPATGVALGGRPATGAALGGTWPPMVDALQGTVRAGLPGDDPRAIGLADELAALADAIAADGATAANVGAVQALCERVRRLFAHRHHLVDELGSLCRELAEGLTELAEDDSWARGQCQALQARLAPKVGDAHEDAHADADADSEPGSIGAAGLSVRGVRAATELLADTRQRQRQVRGERAAAQEAIKTLIQRMISEAGELGDQAGRFQQAVGQHAQAIERADSLESLAGVVRAMLDDSRAVQSAVSATRDRLHVDQSRAQALESRVRELESELRRLSDEVATDVLTQVANRRGLEQAFATLVAGHAREQHAGEAPLLAVGLLDIDNFKKLNDTLGHAAGDVALKSLAQAVRERLRPVDHLARFGGEEFVVLLPGTALAEAQQALTRLQRGLSAGLFMHEGKDVFVTFSAGVTAWQAGESLQTALERADEALYEAKRTGKNRTCAA
jgi:diguanylate cyclase